MGLAGLVATGVCAMMGAAINIVPIMIQRNVPGIGPYVLPAYLLGVVPAIFAALAYASLASGMPRAGGSYVYASRALHPYLGFVASFSQWFGLSIAIGVVSYLLVPFLRDVAVALEMTLVAEVLETGPWRVGIALAFLWTFTGVNVLGVKFYERTLVPLAVLMFLGGLVVLVSGLLFEHADFVAAVAEREGVVVDVSREVPFDLGKLLAASAILFSSFIGFDSIAQAGGEAKNPNKTLPLAIGIAVVTVGSFYILFTAAMYRAVPWTFMAERAQTTDLTAPGLLGYMLSTRWTVLIVGGAAIALINDLPAMILSVSRLMFAWAEDGIFPKGMAVVNATYHTPHRAIVASAGMASFGILGSHLAGDFFLGVDILVTAMLVNFLLMCLSVVVLPMKNPEIAANTRFLDNRTAQLFVGIAGALFLGLFLVVHTLKDLSADVPAWYFHSSALYLLVMALATAVFVYKWRQTAVAGVDLRAKFKVLPEE